MVSSYHHPDSIYLGDVRNIKIVKGKINHYGNTYGDFELIIGGSPCQSFSFAGRRKGMTTTENIRVTTLKQYLKLKKEGFEFVGQSYLFWEFVLLVKSLKPKYFLLENVKMDKQLEKVITEALGVKPILINLEVLLLS